MTTRRTGHLLNGLLAEARWSAGDLARAVNALGTRQGIPLRYDRSAVAHWMAGSFPRPPAGELAAQALSQRLDRVVTPEETGLVRAGGGAGSDAAAPPARADPVRELMALCRSDASPTRRGLLAEIVYDAAYVPPPGRRGGTGRPAPRMTHRAGAGDVELMRRLTQVFSDLAASHGGGHARTALAAYLGDDVARALRSTAPPGLRAELFTSAAQLTHVLAASTDDAGRSGLAQRYYRLALGLAAEAEDLRMRAIVLRSLSAQAARLGHRGSAAAYADEAVRAARATGDDVTVSFALVQRSLTYALKREERAARADMAAAERLHDRATGRPGPFTAYPRSGLDYQRAEVFHALGQRKEAVGALRQAVALRPPGQHRAHALTQARLAEVLFGDGETEEAFGHWSLFLDHYPHIRSARAEQALARLSYGLSTVPHQADGAALRARASAMARTRRTSEE
ncbi:tol-pal system YbgF family protein [Streptomyces sp. NPDC050842]|uniref:tol-pal system YbgF family protein n=1 Tax=Streptomyces sp. NPDC050842 TaxID=3365636 RepID=UPI00379E8A37